MADSDSPDRTQHGQFFHVPGEYIQSDTHAPILHGISSGKDIFEWYLGFLSALSTLGTLGAGFTLSVVVQSSSKSNAAGINPSTVVTLAAVSSMLFVLTVLVCQGCIQLLKFEHKIIVRGIDTDDHAIKHSLAGMSLLLEAQVLGAFLFLELVLAAHAPIVGWVGIAITSLLALLALYLWGVEASRQWPACRHWAFWKFGCSHDGGRCG